MRCTPLKMKCIYCLHWECRSRCSRLEVFRKKDYFYLLQKRLWHRCFHVNFPKFLRIPFKKIFKSTSGGCFCPSTFWTFLRNILCKFWTFFWKIGFLKNKYLWGHRPYTLLRFWTKGCVENNFLTLMIEWSN